jgi:ribosomal protein S12 methylthiotransferase accessory factor YcaO
MNPNSYEYWLPADRQKKYSGTGVTRSVPPSATIRRVRARMHRVGITKVAEVTKLDRIGIPNFMTVRPHDLGPGISYYNGKGTTRADAHAGALMEAVERHGGESCDYPVLTGCYADLQRRYACVDPRDIHVPTAAEFDENTKLEWVAGFELLKRRETLTPLNCVISPYEPRTTRAVFYTSTNGLASGNTRLEALCHALCEVIERDASAVTMAKARIRPAVTDLLAEMGFNCAGDREHDAPPLISLRGLPRPSALLVGKLQRAGLKVYLRNLTSTAGIPTIDCTIVERGPDGLCSAHGGTGTHPDARVALSRALTEAAQSRVALIQGGREDLPEVITSAAAYDPDAVFGARDTIGFDEIPSHENLYVNEDVEFLLERMAQCDFEQIVAFDLTRPDVGIPVVRVVVPRSEAWTIFHLHTRRAALGSRVLRELEPLAR